MASEAKYDLAMICILANMIYIPSFRTFGTDILVT